MSKSLLQQNTLREADRARVVEQGGSADGNAVREVVVRQVKALEQAIREVLQANRGAMTEQQLIQTLSQPPYSLVNAASLRSQLGLFQLHFLIFHTLYRLRQHDSRMLIHTLHIGYRQASIADELASQATGVTPDRAGMSEADCVQHMQDSAESLSRYYLDLDNLFSTSSGDVQALLDGFWNTFGRAVTAPSVKDHTAIRGC